MGNSNVSPFSDTRVEKTKRRLHLKNDDINTLYLKFSKYDREGNGLITREDFFVKFLEEERNFFGDAIFNLVECESQEVVSFGEYIEAICTYCLFEKIDILRLCFNIFDMEKTGFINTDEVKHFLLMLHGGTVKSNARKGLEYIDKSQREDGRIGFLDLVDLHKQYPMLLYPVFRMQNTLMRETLGNAWWAKKKVAVAEEARIKKNKSKIADAEMDDVAIAKKEMELEVKRVMGQVKYFLLPWQRESVRQKINKMKKIEEELIKREEFEAEDV